MQTMMTIVSLPAWALGGGALLIGAAAFVAGALWDALVPERDKPDTTVLENTRLWRELATEQERADRWRSLYERMQELDGLSPAARNIEERAIAKEALDLRGDLTRVPLRWKTTLRFKAPSLPELRA